jgi:peptidyl-dipeptidase Dcp
MSDSNPLLRPSPLPLQYPPFDLIQDDHYEEALESGMAEQIAEVEAIAAQVDPPTLENTLVALEKSGRTLTRVARVFYAMAGADTSDEIEEIRARVAPKMAAHGDAIGLNQALFDRIKSVYDGCTSKNYYPESLRLIEETYKDFVRSGALLAGADKERLTEINAELASLKTTFSQNVLNEVNSKAVVVDDVSELEGMSGSGIAAAAEAARERGLEGKYVIALLSPSNHPALATLENRGLRERIYKASISRGCSGGEFDNRENLCRIAKLRYEKAKLLGFESHAALSLDDQTAQTTGAVNDRLATLTPPAVVNARREAADLQAMIDREGGGFELQPWDWSYYSEKVRQDRFSFDESELGPYLELQQVLTGGVFFAAEKLYRITINERPDLPVYHPDATAWEVQDEDGSTLALFITDFYARPSKRGGAWMNAFVLQSGLLNARPVIANTLNIPKLPDGQPTLLTWDEVTTLFHEFGHALHGMFSDVRYPSFAGTSVPRDFVEFPSQVNEMWASWPEVLANYAVHHETGQAIPEELVAKVRASEKFNQGFTTTEYLAASHLDQAWHQTPIEELPDAAGLLEFENYALKRAGVGLDAIAPRYRSTYFSHIMGGYSAGYYAYIWAEVLDADTVEWFEQNGGLTRENGDHFRASILSRGGSEDAMTLYRKFRGADPEITPLLERRGLN